MSDRERAVLLEVRRRGLRLPGAQSTSLWPAPYDTPESAVDFVLKELRTWNEAEQQVQPFPDLDYLRETASEWVECKTKARALMIEKCRRMVISWLLRGLELHSMGLSRSDQLLSGADFDSASKHVWRLSHLYDDLRQRRPEWKLPAAKRIRDTGERKLVQFSLANGSLCERTNDDPDQVRGEGKSIITFEELSIFRRPRSCWAQAMILTQGAAGQMGGFVVGVCNASANPEWRALKELA